MKIWIHASVTSDYIFVELDQFRRQFKKLKLNESDLEELKQSLINSEPEACIGSSVYKFRWAPSRWNSGQRGATRVIYIDIIKDSKVYLVSIYVKNVKSNLTSDEEKAIRQLSKLLSKKGD